MFVFQVVTVLLVSRLCVCVSGCYGVTGELIVCLCFRLLLLLS